MLGVATHERRGVAPAEPQRLGLLLVEGERRLGTVELEPQPVLATG
jgi:hypothetical protein